MLIFGSATSAGCSPGTPRTTTHGDLIERCSCVRRARNRRSRAGLQQDPASTGPRWPDQRARRSGGDARPGTRRSAPSRSGSCRAERPQHPADTERSVCHVLEPHPVVDWSLQSCGSIGVSGVVLRGVLLARHTHPCHRGRRHPWVCPHASGGGTTGSGGKLAASRLRRVSSRRCALITTVSQPRPSAHATRTSVSQ
jgi:hypothetical protein